jgi:hypothetical protein
VGALNSLHVEIHRAGLGVGPNGSVAGICEWARLPVAEAGHVVFIAAEILALGGSI